jgi:hypothetical protein
VVKMVRVPIPLLLATRCKTLIRESLGKSFLL